MSERLDVDFLVIGGGMAGMTAAAFAAHHSLKVGVIEKGPRIGGSAILSGGCLWTVARAAILDEMSPLSEEGQRHAVVESYGRALAWLESTGIMIRRMPMEALPSRKVFSKPIVSRCASKVGPPRVVTSLK